MIDEKDRRGVRKKWMRSEGEKEEKNLRGSKRNWER